MMNKTPAPKELFKSQLAKLLATENLSFRHSPAAKTAHFDMKNRELVLPVWKNISEDLYDMLVVHEVGHALETPADGWLSAINSIAKKVYGNNVSERAKNAVRGFLNVVEDARIDRLQKIRYPGSKRNYVVGYRELINRDFFGTTKRKIENMIFIDRANMYFKGGVFMGIKFTSEERRFLKMMEETKTFDDVVRVTEEIFAWAKDKAELNQKFENDLSFDESAEDDEDFSVWSLDLDDEGDDDGEGASVPGDNDSDEESDDEGDSSSKSENKPGDKQDENSNNVQHNKGAGSSDMPVIPESETFNAYEKNMSQIVSNADCNYVYVDVPVACHDKIVDDYKLVLKEMQICYDSQNTVVWRKARAASVRRFMRDENATISFLVKEFEQRKAAELYVKTRIAKTGMIDTNKLNSYKFSDDIFRRVTTVPQGKNHGFVMFLDWSGSMADNMVATIKQLISLTMFCKRIQVPFEVYSFRDMTGRELNSHSRNQFVTTGTSYIEIGSTFRLRNIISSRMTAGELLRAYEYLLSFNTLYYVEPMSGTPLNGAIIAAEKIVNDFRNRNKIEIVNTIFLTDGASNQIANFIVDKTQYPHRRSGNIAVIRDSKTKKEYRVDHVYSSDLTNVFLQILKDRTQSNLIGFFLTQSEFQYSGIVRYLSKEENVEKVKNFWLENKFYPVTTTAYDEYYLINAKAMSKIGKSSLEIKENMSKGAIAQKFLSFNESKTINRVLLRKFAERVSKSEKAA